MINLMVIPTLFVVKSSLSESHSRLRQSDPTFYWAIPWTAVKPSHPLHWPLVREFSRGLGGKGEKLIIFPPSPFSSSIITWCSSIPLPLPLPLPLPSLCSLPNNHCFYQHYQISPISIPFVPFSSTLHTHFSHSNIGSASCMWSELGPRKLPFFFYRLNKFTLSSEVSILTLPCRCIVC